MFVNMHNKQGTNIVESKLISYYNTVKQKDNFSAYLLTELQYPLFKLVFINSL